MARVKREVERSTVKWTVREYMEKIEDGLIDFDIDIQRGYVWKSNEQKSLLIQSLIMNDFIPPFYFNRIDGKYEGVDSKQRTYTIKKFINDEFALTGVELIEIINDENEEEEIDINNLKFSELPEFIQNTIQNYSLSIEFLIEANQDAVSRNFFNLNNGTKLNTATINRVRAKSKDAIVRLSKHKLFNECLSKVALEGHVNDDLVVKAHAVLHHNEPSMNATWVRKYMKEAEITEADEKELNEIFNNIYEIHSLIEDKKIAKRIYTRTHLISIIPVVLKGMIAKLSVEQMMEWFVSFFSGRRSATISHTYNSAAGSGSGKKDAVRKRLTAIDEHWNEYFKDTLASVK